MDVAIDMSIAENAGVFVGNGVSAPSCSFNLPHLCDCASQVLKSISNCRHVAHYTRSSPSDQSLSITLVYYNFTQMYFEQSG